MTINLLRGKTAATRGLDQDPMLKGLTIGEMDSHIFSCPSCSRPLSEGTSRCPACGVRLVLGVKYRRAAAILGLGFVAGILLGGVLTASVITLSLHDTPAAAAVDVATPPPVPAAIPSAAVVAVVGPPQAAISALSGTAVVNGRISVDAVTLSTALADPKTTTIAIARALRSLSADAALGTDLVGRLATWRDAGTAPGQLGDFYRTMSKTATLALRGSLNDASGYRRSAVEMEAVLIGLRQVDDASRTLAATIDLELPPVVLPGQ
jgi:hypothetical protein